MFIQPNWPAPPRIKAFTTTRQGGKSLPPYESFNLGFDTSDPVETVRANRQHLTQQLHLPSEPIWLKQIHGNTVVEALPANLRQEADASFTGKPGTVCAVMTADCLPLLLCDQKGSQVAAIHAGWRGLAKGIIDSTVKSLALNNSELLAWLGPAIGPQKFEVGKDVYDCFLALAPHNKAAFTPLTASTWLANIYDLARLQLQALGVSKIYGGNYCTFSETANFFSYRRDQGQTGRMATLIWIEEN